MATMVRVLLIAAVTAGFQASAYADVKFRNLTNETIWYCTGAKVGSLWKSVGWFELKPKEQAKLPATTYVRFKSRSGENLTPSGENKGSFWMHDARFEIDQSNDGGEVHLNGKRTTTAGLKSKGYVERRFSKFADGSVFPIGSYYKVGSRSFQFSHSTSGVKTERFSYLNNTIIDYSVSFSSKRGTSGESWHGGPGSTSLSYVVTLRGGSWPNEWRPSFKGTTTLFYVWR